MKLHSIGIEIFTIEYCLRQPNYVLVSRRLKQSLYSFYVTDSALSDTNIARNGNVVFKLTSLMIFP